MSATPDQYDDDWDLLARRRNSAACYHLGIAAAREKCIRSKQIKPATPTEERWAAEGPVKPSELETVRG